MKTFDEVEEAEGSSSVGAAPEIRIKVAGLSPALTGKLELFLGRP